MKFPVIIALILLAQIPLTLNERTSAQNESVFTLVSSDGGALAEISDYTLTDNQFCFTVTNVSSCQTILGIGPDFAQGAIKATNFTQTGPGVFVLSSDKSLSDVNGQFSVEVAFALLADLSSLNSDLQSGINPGESTHFCLQGDFKSLKAKNIAKSLEVVSGIFSGCPISEPLSCSGVVASFEQSTTSCGSDACISVTNNSASSITATFSFLGLAFSGTQQITVPSGQTRTSCGTVSSHGGTVAWQMVVLFPNGSTCTASQRVTCQGGLSETLGVRR